MRDISFREFVTSIVDLPEHQKLDSPAFRQAETVEVFKVGLRYPVDLKMVLRLEQLDEFQLIEVIGKPVIVDTKCDTRYKGQGVWDVWLLDGRIVTVYVDMFVPETMTFISVAPYPDKGKPKGRTANRITPVMEKKFLAQSLLRSKTEGNDEVQKT